MKSHWFWNGPDYKWAVAVYSGQEKTDFTAHCLLPNADYQCLQKLIPLASGAMKSYWFWNGPDYKWAVAVYSGQEKTDFTKIFYLTRPDRYRDC